MWKTPKEDDTTVTRKSKSQSVAKSFGDDYVVYLMDMTFQESLRKHIHLLTLTFGRKQYAVRWIL
jgi:predicted transcriptional regulator